MNGEEVRFLSEVDVLPTRLSVVRKVISPGEKCAVPMFLGCMHILICPKIICIMDYIAHKKYFQFSLIFNVCCHTIFL
jgi:hypothetical protein